MAACRSQSFEYVGKAGKELGGYTAALAETAEICEIRKDRQACTSDAFGPEIVAGAGAPRKANVYETDAMIEKALGMLEEYGGALQKLSGKKSVGGSELVEGVLTLDAAGKWVDLKDAGPKAIKEGAKLIDRLIIGGLQRKIFQKEYRQLDPQMGKIEAEYTTVIKGELLLLCELETDLAETRDNVQASCATGCPKERALTMIQVNDLRARLKARRKQIRGAAKGLSLFFAAHHQLGMLVDGSKTDRDVLAAVKSAGKEASAAMEKMLREYEAEQCEESPAPAPPGTAGQEGTP